MDRIISRNFRVFSHNVHFFIAKYLHYVFRLFQEIFLFYIWIFRILERNFSRSNEMRKTSKFFFAKNAKRFSFFGGNRTSVASRRRKWLRTTHTKERRTRTNSLSLSDRSKISSDWYQNQKHYQPILPFIYREHFIKYYEKCPFNSDFLFRSVFSWWPSLLLRVYRCGSLLPTQSTTFSHSGRGWWPVYPTSRWSYIIFKKWDFSWYLGSSKQC